jgi:predicted RNA-binding protein associated with RNAse of E/G family
MKRTFADRPSWTRIIEKRFRLTYIEEKDFKGYVSIIYIDKVSEPLIIEAAGENLCLVNDGFIWIQHFPKDCNYALTTMFNEKYEVVQWYFDICNGNKINSLGIPYYDDLYLDVVLLPTGQILLLDEDELEQALNDNDITKEQYELSYLEAQNIIHNIQNSKEVLPLNSEWYLKHMKTLG